jgi:hypothetical protein
VFESRRRPESDSKTSPEISLTTTAITQLLPTTHPMDAPPHHFPARHYEGIADGPFKSLNPTARRFPLAKKPAAAAVDAQAKGEASTEDVRADDVQQQWRSRDNRKGTHPEQLPHPH